MNGSMKSCQELATSILSSLNSDSESVRGNEYLISPPFLYIDAISRQIEKDVVILAGQDCSASDNGAHTGDISCEMLKDVGAKSVILGHSERRQNHGETSQDVAKKAEKAAQAKMAVIICVCETLEEREAGEEFEIVRSQILTSLPSGATGQDIDIAYEPVWAIGTGKTASAEDVEAMHDFIRNILNENLDKADEMRILYGGSVKPENAKELAAVSNVGGFLIGGASLKAESFLEIGREALLGQKDK